MVTTKKHKAGYCRHFRAAHVQTSCRQAAAAFEKVSEDFSDSREPIPHSAAGSAVRQLMVIFVEAGAAPLALPFFESPTSPITL